MPKHSVVRVFLDEGSIIRRSPEVEQERAVAIYDFLESNHFVPMGDIEGPFISICVSKITAAWSWIFEVNKTSLCAKSDCRSYR